MSSTLKSQSGFKAQDSRLRGSSGRKRKKLGEILQEWRIVTDAQIQQALGMAKGTGKRLGEAMIEAGFCKEHDVVKALASQFDMEFINLDAPEAANSVDMSLVPQDLIKKHLILPLHKTNGRLKLVIHDPMDLELLDLLRFRLNSEIDTALAPKSSIKSFIDGKTGVGSGSGGPRIFSEESLVTESVDVTMDRSVDSSVDITVGDDAPIIRLCHRMITEAVRTRASDIHVEPMKDRVILRYRIDGVCHVRDNLPKRMQSSLLAR
ncbi:MAG: hypothetical protein L0Y42_15625, partial [Phycisphaerales bacterium]|nr:hypothetical protein [Phycisphaerales bacterium]